MKQRRPQQPREWLPVKTVDGHVGTYSVNDGWITVRYGDQEERAHLSASGTSIASLMLSTLVLKSQAKRRNGVTDN
jgi:hypothetical protein